MACLSSTPEHHAKQLALGRGNSVGSQASMYRECPHCKEQMRRDARLCPHCRTESDAWTLHDGGAISGPGVRLDAALGRFLMAQQPLAPTVLTRIRAGFFNVARRTTHLPRIR